MPSYPIYTSLSSRPYSTKSQSFPPPPLFFFFSPPAKSISHSTNVYRNVGEEGLREAQARRHFPATIRVLWVHRNPSAHHNIHNLARPPPHQAPLLPQGRRRLPAQPFLHSTHLSHHHPSGNDCGEESKFEDRDILRPAGRACGVPVAADNGVDKDTAIVPRAQGHLCVVPLPERQRRARSPLPLSGAGDGRGRWVGAPPRQDQQQGEVEGRQLDLGHLPPPRQLPRASQLQLRPSHQVPADASWGKKVQCRRMNYRNQRARRRRRKRSQRGAHQIQEVEGHVSLSPVVLSYWLAAMSADS